jgi:hypothetical protein
MSEPKIPSWSFAGEVPSEIKGTLKSFKTLQAFFDFFGQNEFLDSPIVGNPSTTYLNLWRENEVDFENYIRNKDMGWYGNPVPISIQDAMERTKYLDMDEYNQVYREYIQPRIQEILKDSAADLEVPVLKYNDLGLGSFDFNKASTGLIALYKYYSFKKKGLVDGFEVETYKVKDTYKYKLKSDGSPVVLVPELKDGYDTKEAQKFLKEVEKGKNVFVALKENNLKIGGKEAFTSTIKKSYILKEKFPKPKNAIRLFVKIGCNYDVRHPKYKWTGYTAVGIAELLSILGYAVNIIGLIGTNNIRRNDFPTRYFAINLKNFDETLDTPSLLYAICDPTFFRIKGFEVIIKSAQYYQDYIDSQLGSSAKIGQLKSMVFNEFGKRDRLFNDKGNPTNSEFLYYIIGDVLGLNDVTNSNGEVLEKGLNSYILDIGLDIVNQNKEAREKLLGI